MENLDKATNDMDVAEKCVEEAQDLRGSFEAQKWAEKRAESMKETILAAYQDPDTKSVILDPDGDWVEIIKCGFQDAYLDGVEAAG